MSSQSDGSVSSGPTVARPILHLDGKLHEEATAKSRAGTGWWLPKRPW